MFAIEIRFLHSDGKRDKLKCFRWR